MSIITMIFDRRLQILMPKIVVIVIFCSIVRCAQQHHDSTTKNANTAEVADSVDSRGDKWASRPITDAQREQKKVIDENAAQDMRSPAEKMGLDACINAFFPNEIAHIWGIGRENCCLHQCPAGYFQIEYYGTMCRSNVNQTINLPKCSWPSAGQGR